MSEQTPNYETFNQKFQEWKADQEQAPQQPSHQGEAKLDVGKYLSHYGIEYKVKTNGEWVRYCLSRCVFDSSHSGGEASIGQHATGKLSYQCFHNSCKGRTWAEARRLISGEDKLTQFMPGDGSRPKQEKPKARLRSLNDLKSKFSGEVSYLWKQHIPKGMPVIINGREGVGKSKNCLAIARDILLANPAGSIIWVSSEGFVSDTITKAYEVGLPMDGRFHIAEKPDGTYRFDFRWKEERDLLAGLLEQVSERILCVFIDSIRGMTGGDDNDPKTGSVMHKLNAIVCDRFGAALVYLDHWKKGKAGTLLDKAVGTTAKTAAVRLVLSIVPTSTYSRKIKMAKSNILPFLPDLRSVEVGKNIVIEQEEEGEETLGTKAEHWLIGRFMETDEVPASEIYEEGKAQGFKDELLRKLKAKIGIGHKKNGVKSIWVSPYRELAQLAQWNFTDSEIPKESDGCKEKTTVPNYCASTVHQGTVPSVPSVQTVPEEMNKHSNKNISNHTTLDASDENYLKSIDADIDALDLENLPKGGFQL